MKVKVKVKEGEGDGEGEGEEKKLLKYLHFVLNCCILHAVGNLAAETKLVYTNEKQSVGNI